MVTFREEAGCDFEVCKGDEGEEGDKDQEVDLGGRCGEGVGIVPVCDCFTYQ